MTARVKGKPPKAPTDWPFVEVEWKDARADSNWRTESELPDLAHVIHRGWLCRDRPEDVTLVAGLVLGKEAVTDVSEIMVIPRGCIISIKPVPGVIPLRKKRQRRGAG